MAGHRAEPQVGVAAGDVDAIGRGRGGGVVHGLGQGRQLLPAAQGGIVGLEGRRRAELRDAAGHIDPAAQRRGRQLRARGRHRRAWRPDLLGRRLGEGPSHGRQGQQNAEEYMRQRATDPVHRPPLPRLRPRA